MLFMLFWSGIVYTFGRFWLAHWRLLAGANFSASPTLQSVVGQHEVILAYETPGNNSSYRVKELVLKNL